MDARCVPAGLDGGLDVLGCRGLPESSVGVTKAVAYEQDYIKRMVQRIGEVLARALGQARAGQYEESQQVLEQGVGSELGVPLSTLLRMDDQTVVSILGKDKAAAFAEALRTRGLLFGLAGRDADAAAAASRAANIERLLA